jgi:hypothetical protein
MWMACCVKSLLPIYQILVRMHMSENADIHDYSPDNRHLSKRFYPIVPFLISYLLPNCQQHFSSGVTIIIVGSWTPLTFFFTRFIQTLWNILFTHTMLCVCVWEFPPVKWFVLISSLKTVELDKVAHKYVFVLFRMSRIR